MALSLANRSVGVSAINFLRSSRATEIRSKNSALVVFDTKPRTRAFPPSTMYEGSKSQLEYRPLPQDDPKKRQPDITRARTLLGWEPKVGRDEGLKRTMAYFKTKIAK